MVGLEGFFIQNRPRLIVVYGDVNSTLAAALVGAKLLIPVAHVEAGLRSGDMTMPEEINRKLTDQVSTLLFATSEDAVGNLNHEGVEPGAVHFVGNPMIDTLLKVKGKLDAATVLARLEVDEPFILATLHRPSNVDDLESARQAVSVLREASQRARVILPLHPRGRASLESAGLSQLQDVTVCEPLTYLEFSALMGAAKAVVTDSGGVQEESTMLGVPCLTLRPNTERPVTITQGTNRLVTPQNFGHSLDAALSVGGRGSSRTPELWDGHAGERIAAVISEWLRNS
jgi:UDP-N-acetylglucosamine 2-epimerase (non-hydrolysing)